MQMETQNRNKFYHISNELSNNENKAHFDQNIPQNDTSFK